MATDPDGAPSLQDVVARLGDGVARLLPGASGTAAVRGVQVHDALHPRPPFRGDVVLGVGVPVTQAGALARELVEQGAAGLLVKDPDDDLVDADAPLAVVSPVVEWARLVELVLAAVDREETEQSLFALCDAVAARVGGPVVLHDERFRLLAYSSGQDLSDPVRRTTILGRRPPHETLERLAAAGVVERLTAGHVVLLEEPDLPPGSQERVGIGLRTQAELLGSLWLQLEPAQAVDEAVLRDCVEPLTLAVLRRRQSRAEGVRREDDLLHRVLGSGDGTSELALRLGVDPDAPCVLVAVALPHTGELDRDVLAGRFSGLVRGFASAYRFTMCTTVVEDTLYALRVARPSEPEPQVGRAVDQLHAQLTRLGAGRVLIALGDPVPLAGIAQTRRDADGLLGLLADGTVPGDVARVADVRGALALDRLRRLVHEAGETLAPGPLAALLAHDREHRAELVPTLRAWLDCGGSVSLTAERLTLHANTVRHRLRRVQELSGLDLDDAEQRFLVELQLRLDLPDRA